jgi:hypothetical protein
LDQQIHEIIEDVYSAAEDANKTIQIVVLASPVEHPTGK